MRDYLLFLDTEASGLPKKWNAPYSDSVNWPAAVQISWMIFRNDGTLIKSENHYIGDKDVPLQASATKIHGITVEFLGKHGESRNAVMQSFADDLIKYEPLVVGHFMEFDYHVTSADFYRAGISNPLEDMPSFCTMLGSTSYSRQPSVSHLRLGELYATLFDKQLEIPHNAFYDAKATAECFFELLQRGDISDEKIESQQSRKKKEKSTSGFPWFLSAMIILLLGFLVGLSI